MPNTSHHGILRHFTWSGRWTALGWVGLVWLAGCLPVPETTPAGVVIDDSDIETLLDRNTSSHLDTGCSVTFLTRGEDSYAAFADAIDHAQASINIETLNFDNDAGFERDIAVEFARKLADKARSGVAVRLVMDPVMQNLISKPEIDEILLDGGVEVRYYQVEDSPSWFEGLAHRIHKKILVADGAVALIGGSNFGIRYFGKDQWRDTNLRFTGPAAATIQAEFIRDWGWLGPELPADDAPLIAQPATGPHTVRLIDQVPAIGDDDINRVVLIALRTARTAIDIEAPYFNPTDWMLEELIAARRRGVRIRILSNSSNAMDVDLSSPILGSFFEPLLREDIDLYLWDLESRTMHSKALIVDDAWAMVGSYNFNARSIIWDTENVAVFTDPELVARTRVMIDDDLAQPHVFLITWDWYYSHSAYERQTWNTPLLLKWAF